MRQSLSSLGMGGHGIRNMAPGTREYDAVTLSQVELSKGITLLNPQVDDNVTMFYTPVPLLIRGVYAMVQGSDSPAVTLRISSGNIRAFAADTHVDDTVATGSGMVDELTGDTAYVPAGTFVWLNVDDVTGTVDELHVSLQYQVFTGTTPVAPLLRIYAIGDSVVQGTVGTTGVWSNSTVPQYGESYVLRTAYKNGHRALMVVQGGIQGETLVQMDARFNTDIGTWVVPGGGVCLISGGGNDIRLSVATQDSLDAVVSMAEKAKSYGLFPIIARATPYDNGTVKINNSTLNGGFETAGAGGADVVASWTETTGGSSTLTRDTSDKFSGTASLLLVRNGGTCQVAQTILTIGKRYRVFFYAKSAAGGDLTVGSASGAGYITQAAPTAWTQYVHEFEATDTSFRIALESDATIAVDLVVLEELNDRIAFDSLIDQIEALAVANGYPVFDINAVFSDGAGGWDDWTDQDDDFVHLTRSGELKAANAFATFLEPYFSDPVESVIPDLIGQLTPTSILAASGCFDGDTSGAGSGTGAPVGWKAGATATGSNGGTRSFVTDAYATGQWHRVTKTGTGNFNILRQIITANLTAHIGQDVLFVCRYRTSGMYESASAHYKLNLAIALGGSPSPAGPFRPLNQAPWETSVEGEVCCCWMKVPSGFTTAEVQATITVTGSPTGACVVDIADIDLIPLPAIGLS